MHHRGEEATGLSPVWVRPVRVCVVAPAKPASAFYSLNPLLSATTAPATHSPPLGLSPCLCVPAAAAVVPACFSSLPQQPPRVGLTVQQARGLHFACVPRQHCTAGIYQRLARRRAPRSRALSSPRVCAPVFVACLFGVVGVVGRFESWQAAAQSGSDVFVVCPRPLLRLVSYLVVPYRIVLYHIYRLIDVAYDRSLLIPHDIFIRRELLSASQAAAASR